MGLDCHIRFPREQAPAWPALAEQLAGRGLAIQLRMIDGELSFPDETPRDDWRELRLGTQDGMITLRRESDGMRLVIWGNADPGLLAARDQISAVIVEITNGTVAP